MSAGRHSSRACRNWRALWGSMENRARRSDLSIGAVGLNQVIDDHRDIFVRERGAKWLFHLPDGGVPVGAGRGARLIEHVVSGMTDQTVRLHEGVTRQM